VRCVLADVGSENLLEAGGVMSERIVMGIFLGFALGMLYMAFLMFNWPAPVVPDFDRAMHGW